MTTLNQLLGVAQGTKSRAERVITDAHHASQRAGGFSGITGTYRPIAEDGVTFPPESTLVQTRAEDLLRDAVSAMMEQIDVTASVDTTNMNALGDIVLPSGEILAVDVPATTLLFLEKKFTDLLTFIKKLPTLPADEDWTPDAGRGVYRTGEIRSLRLEKTTVPVVLYPATDKHPAQVDKVQKDLPVGEWTRIKFSGAISTERKRELVERATLVHDAIRFARVQANDIEVTDKKIARGLLAYVTG